MKPWKIELESFVCPHSFPNGRCSHWNSKTGDHNEQDCPIKINPKID